MINISEIPYASGAAAYNLLPSTLISGENITSGGTIHEYGNYSQLTPSFPFDAFLTEILIPHVAPNPFYYVRIALATGAWGSEVIIGEFKSVEIPVDNNYSSLTPIYLNPPFKILSGTRLSAKAAVGVAGATTLPLTIAYIKIASITEPSLIALEADLVAMDAALDIMIAAVPPAVLAEIIEGGKTLKQILRRFHAVLTGKTTGGGSSIYKFRDIADLLDRITATVDANKNRTTVTFDDS